MIQYEWISKINYEQQRTDEIVQQETVRRNILLDKNIYNSQIWNFDMNLSKDQILSLININAQQGVFIFFFMFVVKCLFIINILIFNTQVEYIILAQL